MLQMGVMLFTFVGEWIFSKLGLPLPAFHATLKDNKMMMVLGFMMLGQIAGQLIATGAFEISVNGKVVFSKLELGRMPTGEDIMSGMARSGL
jgi:selT/selW/selH-like putative selenoprotein